MSKYKYLVKIRHLCRQNPVIEAERRGNHLSDTRMLQQQGTYEEIERLKQRIVELEKG